MGKAQHPDENAGDARFNAGDDQDWHVVNLADIHIGQAQEGAMRPATTRRRSSPSPSSRC